MKITMKKPVNIPVVKLKPFEENPYKVLDNDEMNTLITSIQEIGITEPLIVRPLENTEEYEVISGPAAYTPHKRQDLTQFLP